MKTSFTQTGAFMTLTTPFGANKLLLDAMEASEGISELFKLTLHMRSGETELDASRIIGNPVTIKLEIPGGPIRYFNGIVSRFVHSGGDRGFSYYSAEIVPKLWLLTLSRDRAIWQSKTVSDIIKSVLNSFGVTVQVKLTGTYTPLDYCVQYDESAFDFISRLMEGAGIFYFFTFTDSAHTLVLADDLSAHSDCANAATVRFFPETGTHHMIDTISSFELEHSLVTQTHTLSDYDPLKPSTDLLVTAQGKLGKGLHFEWPGKHDAVGTGKAVAKQRTEASQLDTAVLRGDSYVYSFTAGSKFTLKEHFRKSLNAAHVLRRVHHTIRDALYCNSFEAFPATVPFRAPRLTPLPRVTGSQTALVVGPKGEEIWTDKYARIKVQFPWDRLGKKDEKSSCWVRVAQATAGAGFGSLFLPRIGQEVVISYIDADPDRPLVTGCVYNGENEPPVTLPTNQTQTVIKTRSSKGGKEGNEIRLEDKKDTEEFFLHAQKDMKVAIENNLTTTLLKGAEIHTLEEGDRTLELKKGKEIYKIKGTRDLSITGDENHKNEANYKQEVNGDYELKVTGNLILNITGDITIKSAKSVTIKSGTAFENNAGTELKNKAGTALLNQAGTDLTNKASLGLVNEANTTLDNKAATITHKASAMQTVDGGGMLTVKGGLVKIN